MLMHDTFLKDDNQFCMAGITKHCIPHAMHMDCKLVKTYMQYCAQHSACHMHFDGSMLPCFLSWVLVKKPVPMGQAHASAFLHQHVQSTFQQNQQPGMMPLQHWWTSLMLTLMRQLLRLMPS